MSEKRGEETGVLQQNPAHDAQVGGHNHWISLYTCTQREIYARSRKAKIAKEKKKLNAQMQHRVHVAS